ncbi:uncharacterized protein LOC133783627 [Humulus lupulus]|uniref:uncharacterized protein LOC133783627 n=1 Tax=Humulus lupulus TaxID=3486 RepID=UPI002B40FCB1|nr:uncharacterized protein LOC133783627 [Humulus lupulus]
MVTLGDKEKIRKPFRFENMWTRDLNYFWVIKRAWQSTFQGDLMRNFNHKLIATKKNLAKWNQLHFRSIHDQIRLAKAKLQKVELDTLNDFKRELQARKNLNEVLKREEIFWKQKSRIKWLREGDRSTKFFHASTIIRRRRNYISTLKSFEGTWTYGRESIDKLFLEGFKKQFMPARTTFPNGLDGLLDSSISEQQNEALCLILEATEIEEALNQINSDKASGSDGFPDSFYKLHWEIIKTDVVAMVKCFFEQARMPHFLNRVNIVLIPKKENAGAINDYRTIALCNIAYKII